MCRRCHGKLLCLEVKARDLSWKLTFFVEWRRFLLWNYLNGLIALLDQAEQFENQTSVQFTFNCQLVLKLIRFCQENRNSIQCMLGPCMLWLSWKLRKVIKSVKIVILEQKWMVIMKRQSKKIIFGSLSDFTNSILVQQHGSF